MPNRIRRLVTSDEFLLGLLTGIATASAGVLAFYGRPMVGVAIFLWLAAYVSMVANKMRE